MQWPLIMVFAVWLCPYPDGVARVRRDGQRHRLYLPQPAWFLDVLRVNALTHHLSEGVNRKPESRIRGMAVVSTDGQQRNEGLLTPWSAEALLQMAYYAWPSDAYQSKCLIMLRVSRPLPPLCAALLMPKAAWRPFTWTYTVHCIIHIGVQMGSPLRWTSSLEVRVAAQLRLHSGLAHMAFKTLTMYHVYSCLSYWSSSSLRVSGRMSCAFRGGIANLDWQVCLCRLAIGQEWNGLRRQAAVMRAVMNST